MKQIRTTAPEWSILNPAFVYTSAAATDVAARFRRIYRERAEIEKARAEQAERERNNVRQMRRANQKG